MVPEIWLAKSVKERGPRVRPGARQPPELDHTCFRIGDLA